MFPRIPNLALCNFFLNDFSVAVQPIKSLISPILCSFSLFKIKIIMMSLEIKTWLFSYPSVFNSLRVIKLSKPTKEQSFTLQPCSAILLSMQLQRYMLRFKVCEAFFCPSEAFFHHQSSLKTIMNRIHSGYITHNHLISC